MLRIVHKGILRHSLGPVQRSLGGFVQGGMLNTLGTLLTRSTRAMAGGSGWKIDFQLTKGSQLVCVQTYLDKCAATSFRQLGHTERELRI